MIGRRASDADAEQTNWRWGARPIAAYWVRALIAAACRVYAINPLQGQASPVRRQPKPLCREAQVVGADVETHEAGRNWAQQEGAGGVHGRRRGVAVGRPQLHGARRRWNDLPQHAAGADAQLEPVSYTHLTLPTKRIV